MAKSEIYFGSVSSPTFYFSDEDLHSVTGSVAVDIVGDELAVDEVDSIVEFNRISENIQVFSPSDYGAIRDAENCLFSTSYTGTADLLSVPYGTPIWYYFDGNIVGKFYLKEIIRTAKNQYKVVAMSPIGLLDGLLDYGGLFTVVAGDTFKSVLAGILGGSVGSLSNGLYPITGGVFDCFVEQQVGNLPIYGWLPIATKRENLHQLLFAENVTIAKSSDGTPVFSFLYNSETPESLSPNRIYMGGSVNYNSPATAVEITEHTYLEPSASDPIITLFDSSVEGSGNNDVVQFTEPMYGLKWNGSAFTGESGANYAIVNGSGVLTGQKWVHSKKVYRKDVVGPSGSVNEKSVSNFTLINSVNSSNVADRVLAYYASAKYLNADIVLTDGNPKCGRQYTLTDVFGDESEGFVSEITLNASGIMKASCKIITDYVPTGQGNNFSHAVLMESGNWTVPSGITKARFILIGGGQGGTDGADGSDGTRCTISSGSVTAYSVGGNGGEGGEGGASGKVLTVDFDASTSAKTLTPLSTVTISYGQGGARGSHGGSGSLGSATSITVSGTSYSSASGSSPSGGIINLFNGRKYAVKGEDGIDGGKGGDYHSAGESVTYNGTTWSGGSSGISSDINDSRHSFEYGGGGGAAYGHAGYNGEPEYWNDYSGRGGNGADASSPSSPGIGCGGNGGHGGAGGGGGGLDNFHMYPFGTSAEEPGTHGDHSDGTSGGKGAVLIYY